MDLEIDMKEEPARLEGTTNASLENIEHVSDMIVLKKEAKLELTEPGQTQENSLEPSKDIKEEIYIEEHTDDQLLPYVKEETKSRPEGTYADHQSPDVRTPNCCSVCGKLLACKSKLTLHMRTHTGEKPFSCNVCGKSFSQSVLLSRHMLTHTGKKSYPCTVCRKIYSRKDVLAEHMRTHTGDKPHCCETCGKFFRQRVHLTFHMRTHTGEKQYSCNMCSKSLSSKVQRGRNVREVWDEPTIEPNHTKKSTDTMDILGSRKLTGTFHPVGIYRDVRIGDDVSQELDPSST
ncbi:zinc finger protein 577-like [Anabrus simplex]|uniref:zinc finger protein 577-like n=1 Tax=Anabrus simplex TaxID=316456 RepID=UPI0035A37041